MNTVHSEVCWKFHLHCFKVVAEMLETDILPDIGLPPLTLYIFIKMSPHQNKQTNKKQSSWLLKVGDPYINNHCCIC